jgi:hypothetical protein
MTFETNMRICARCCILCFVFSVASFITINTINPFVSKLCFLILAIYSVLTAFKLEQIANEIKIKRLCNFPHKHVKFDIQSHEEE